MVVPVSSSTPNSTPMNSRGAAIHVAQTVRQRTADGEADEPGGVLTADRGVRRPRPEVPQSQGGQGDHRRAEDQAWARLRVGPGAHQHHGDHGQRDGQQYRPRIRSACATCRRSTPRPVARRRTTNWRRSRRRRPASARAIPSRRCPGSMSWARPTDRAVPPTPLATINQVARAARPTPAPAAATTDGLLRRVAGLVGFLRFPRRRSGLPRTGL